MSSNIHLSRLHLMNWILDIPPDRYGSYQDWLQEFCQKISEDGKFSEDCCKVCIEQRMIDLFFLRFRESAEVMGALMTSYNGTPNLLDLAYICEEMDRKKNPEAPTPAETPKAAGPAEEGEIVPSAQKPNLVEDNQFEPIDFLDSRKVQQQIQKENSGVQQVQKPPEQNSTNISENPNTEKVSFSDPKFNLKTVPVAEKIILKPGTRILTHQDLQKLNVRPLQAADIKAQTGPMKIVVLKPGQTVEQMKMSNPQIQTLNNPSLVKIDQTKISQNQTLKIDDGDVHGYDWLNEFTNNIDPVKKIEDKKEPPNSPEPQKVTNSPEFVKIEVQQEPPKVMNLPEQMNIKVMEVSPPKQEPPKVIRPPILEERTLNAEVAELSVKTFAYSSSIMQEDMDDTRVCEACGESVVVKEGEDQGAIVMHALTHLESKNPSLLKEIVTLQRKCYQKDVGNMTRCVICDKYFREGNAHFVQYHIIKGINNEADQKVVVLQPREIKTILHETNNNDVKPTKTFTNLYKTRERDGKSLAKKDDSFQGEQSDEAAELTKRIEAIRGEIDAYTLEYGHEFNGRHCKCRHCPGHGEKRVSDMKIHLFQHLKELEPDKYEEYHAFALEKLLYTSGMEHVCRLCPEGKGESKKTRVTLKSSIYHVFKYHFSTRSKICFYRGPKN